MNSALLVMLLIQLGLIGIVITVLLVKRYGSDRFKNRFAHLYHQLIA
jgi:hypothetical protein